MTYIRPELTDLLANGRIFCTSCRVILGEDTAEKLLKTVIYMIGMHCALRGGAEHNKLQRPGFDSQLNVEFDDRGVKCLVYHEDSLQKTNQGGLLCKGRSKVVYVYGASYPSRCPIQLFEKYISLLPQSKKCKKLYLRCRKKLTSKVWYCDQAYGENCIKTTVKDVCNSTGISGKFTNHSLRAM